MLNIKTKKLPSTSGVYFFKDTRGKVLYIGKASNLKHRIKSYGNIKSLSPLKRQMVDIASKVSYKKTDSDIEALILEASLIKKHLPAYNVMLKDDKNYSFVAITKEDFPKVLLTRQPLFSRNEGALITNIKAEFIGPFTDATAIKNVISTLRNAFPYCTCRSKLKHKRICINAEIRKCLGYCCLKNPEVSDKEIKLYKKNINYLKAVLTGKRKSILKKLLRDMQLLSKKKYYEEAAIKRDQIKYIKKIFRHSSYIKKDSTTDRAKGLRLLKETILMNKIPNRIEGYDISNIQGKHPVGSMVVFIDGVPEKSKYKKFSIKKVTGPNDPAMLHEIISRRLKHSEWEMPDFMLIDGGAAQLSAAYQAVKKVKLNVGLGAIAKRNEELYYNPRKNTKGKTSYKVVGLRKLSPNLLHLLQHVRDESHRFAIAFHRRKRSASMNIK